MPRGHLRSILLRTPERGGVWQFRSWNSVVCVRVRRFSAWSGSWLSFSGSFWRRSSASASTSARPTSTCSRLSMATMNGCRWRWERFSPALTIRFGAGAKVFPHLPVGRSANPSREPWTLREVLEHRRPVHGRGQYQRPDASSRNPRLLRSSARRVASSRRSQGNRGDGRILQGPGASRLGDDALDITHSCKEETSCFPQARVFFL